MKHIAFFAIAALLLASCGSSGPPDPAAAAPVKFCRNGDVVYVDMRTRDLYTSHEDGKGRQSWKRGGSCRR